MSWIMYKTSSGRNSYENYDATPCDTFKIATFLKKVYGDQLITEKEIWNTIKDDIYFKVKIFHYTICVGWDNWSGAFIMSEDENSDPFIHEIAKHMQTDPSIHLP